MSLLKEIINENTNEEILAFFKKNPNPSDKEVHDLAEKLGIEPDDLEERIYKILSGELNESFISDLKRKMSGKVTGKEQIRRIALSALQRTVDMIKDFDKHLDDPKKFQEWAVEHRKKLIEAIKIIKAVEK